MPDTRAQSGVRSLLAKFENNNQSSPTSPPSRGRSPVGSDTPGSGRPLSKVRASFVAVDRAAQSSPVTGLRKESGRSDSSALKSVGSDDADAALRSPVSSPSSNGLDVQKPADDPSPRAVQADTERKASTEGSGSHALKVDSTSPAERLSTKDTKPEPNRSAATVATEQSLKQSPAAKTVTKRPSNVQLAKNKPATSSTSKAPSTGPKSPVRPRTSATSTKPASETAAKTSRESAAASAKSSNNEPAKSVTQQPSRTSLNPSSKTTTRTSRETTKPAVSPTAPKPARLPASTTAPALSSTAKAGPRQNGAATATSNLNKKPSSLKVANNRTQGATTPTSSVRKQPSRTSLPNQPGIERPGSRVSSTDSKPVDEGFLARMMRPTASSASKMHDKIEVKSPPRPSKAARDPKKVPPKADQRAAHEMKEEDASEKTQKEKPQPEAKQQAQPKKPKDIQSVEEAKEEVIEPHGEFPNTTEQPALESTENILEEPMEQPSSGEPEEPAVETVEMPSAEPAESPAEPAVEASGDDPVETPVEPIEPTVQDSGNEPTEVPALNATAPHEPSATQAEEAAPQPTGATDEFANPDASASEEHIPSISEPPPESAQPSADTPRYDTPDPKETIKMEHSADSSVETSFVDTVESASPAETKLGETGVDAGTQEHEEPTATIATTAT